MLDTVWIEDWGIVRLAVPGEGAVVRYGLVIE